MTIIHQEGLIDSSRRMSLILEEFLAVCAFYRCYRYLSDELYNWRNSEFLSSPCDDFWLNISVVKHFNKIFSVQLSTDVCVPFLCLFVPVLPVFFLSFLEISWLVPICWNYKIPLIFGLIKMFLIRRILQFSKCQLSNIWI